VSVALGVSSSWLLGSRCVGQERSSGWRVIWIDAGGKTGMFSAGLKRKKPSHQRGLHMKVYINGLSGGASFTFTTSSISALLGSCRYCEA
jgi:hypothetical protein